MKYDDKHLNIKFIYAQRIGGGEWEVKGLSSVCRSIEDSNMFESTPMGIMARSEFAIFRNRDNWQDHKPIKYLQRGNYGRQ